MADSPSEPRAKRQRVDKKGRFAALEKLKQLKGNKNKYNVEDEVDNVYEIVDEQEYAKKAMEKYGGNWLEEDGTGYAEDGRDFFEDEDEFYNSDEKSSTSNKEKGSKKRPRDVAKPAKGKGSIRNLFSNAVQKKSTAPTKLADDDILADILGNINDKPEKIIAPARIISTATRKSDAIIKTPKNDPVKTFLNNIKPNENDMKLKKAKDNEFLERILKPKTTESNIKNVNIEKTTTTHDTPKTPTKTSENIEFIDDVNFDDFEYENVDENTKTTNKTDEEEMMMIEKKSIQDDNNVDMNKLLNNWETICQMDNFDEEMQQTCETEQTDDNDILKFWWWDAWEDANKLPGQVFLFGRTIDGQSLCVRVENIERVLYMLPREYLLDPITKESTTQKVTLTDLYKEFDDDIAIDLKLTDFRTRKVTKNFAYHSIGINIPQTCDYMEVRYTGKKPPPDTKKKYNSIAHIFGAGTTSLETFLLDRKIKGPCWLTIKQFQHTKAPLSWCKNEILVNGMKPIIHADETQKAPPPPQLTILTLNLRTTLNNNNLQNEICMISMLVHNRFHIDKAAPKPAFNRHMCAFTRPAKQNWPFDLNGKLTKYTSTKIFKHESERALLSWFLAQYQQIDPDLLITHDALDCQLDVLFMRVMATKIPQWSRLGRLRMTQVYSKKPLDYYVGRMICDVKEAAEQCINLRAYDLETLCQSVLELKASERMNVNEHQLVEMYKTAEGIFKLITLTMQDASYILRLMCELNILPLALQITNICGNTMARTLLGGRSERNEYLLLHAFTEKNYIVPDKKKREWGNEKHNDDGGTYDSTKISQAPRKKAAYSGGMVLEPIRGFYDKYILLLDFNSLYPSIIQEYNICFTTVAQPYNIDDLPLLPDSTVEQGILPQQLRRLVESRREVKKLLTIPDLSHELKMQYHIRQMALKLTANSMYGCLGYANSRFFAQHLAALVTHKGREILMNTKSLVEKMDYVVVYGDTDSIMVNTNMIDYDQVYKIGHNIKQSVNRLYKQLELDIDGVFSCLLLLKKKKYAAVKVSKTSKGDFKKEQEHKGLDIVRRDWSQLAILVGKQVLDEILAEKQIDEKIDAIHTLLEKTKEQVMNDGVDNQLYSITKQLSRPPNEYKTATTQAHVQVAQRMNVTRNRRYKRGDMVNYVICDDGTTNSAVQRAYHLEELASMENLKIDKDYYLAQQIHPVVTRLVEVLDGTDASRIAECLGLDPKKFKAIVQRSHQERIEDASTGESIIKTTLEKYRQCEKFSFQCVSCKTENIVAAAFRPSNNNSYDAVLAKCANSECTTPPYQYIISIRNQLQLAIRKYIKRFYENWLVCNDPTCNQNTRFSTHVSINLRPVCFNCKSGTFVRQYSERDLYIQLCYLQYIFDLTKQQHKNVQINTDIENAYNLLRETVELKLDKSAYCIISLQELFISFRPLHLSNEVIKSIDVPLTVATTIEDI